MYSWIITFGRQKRNARNETNVSRTTSWESESGAGHCAHAHCIVTVLYTCNTLAQYTTEYFTTHDMVKSMHSAH